MNNFDDYIYEVSSQCIEIKISIVDVVHLIIFMLLEHLNNSYWEKNYEKRSSEWWHRPLTWKLSNQQWHKENNYIFQY